MDDSAINYQNIILDILAEPVKLLSVRHPTEFTSSKRNTSFTANDSHI